jgi:hypothetical protein
VLTCRDQTDVEMLTELCDMTPCRLVEITKVSESMLAQSSGKSKNKFVLVRVMKV